MWNFRALWIPAGTMAILAALTFPLLSQGVAHGGNFPAGSWGGPVPGAGTGVLERERNAPVPGDEMFPGPGRLRIAQPGKVTPEKLERWRSMPPGKKERIRERYRHWKTLSPERRERILEHGRRWEKLPEKERRYLRRRREVYRNAPPEERRAIRKFFRNWKSLPPEQRGAWRRNVEEWKGLPVKERDERLEKWRFYRDLSPGERKAVNRFLFSEGPQGSKGRPPGPRRD